MERITCCCDFCGDSHSLREYLIDRGAITWYACEDCARLIGGEHWETLIEHSLAAYRQIRAIGDSEESLLRDHVEQLVKAFRAFRLATV